ncbi:WXG100 family type VII secretion target [Nocardia sp. N13]|uniref:WXG100 family type VII secretion target n=1 Tax=Nocardioides sp. N13(2025) TaxID=3453405 RepID=UPI003F75E5A2
MSERGLVVHQGSLSAIESALADATTSLRTQVDDLLEEVEKLTPGWDETSESHLAHLEHQQKLRDGIEKLAEALDQVRTRLATYREDARETEVENVAIVN